METTFIEATQTDEFNWGKFMVARFTAEEWARRSAMSEGAPLLRQVGWNPSHILVLDLQTGEGSIFAPGGIARIDLNTKHQIWVCPMFEPFLEWLYAQDLSDLKNLPAKVVLQTNEAALYGHRRKRAPVPTS